jgi:hypothetical protein
VTGLQAAENAGFRVHQTAARTGLELDSEGLTDMASSGKKRTTMAKLTRENRLRERRLDKQAKRDARKLAPTDDPDSPGEFLSATTGEPARTASGPVDLEAVVQTLPDA